MEKNKNPLSIEQIIVLLEKKEAIDFENFDTDLRNRMNWIKKRYGKKY